ncbi:MAG TPA: hypothetical protein VMW27_18325 [Thermoanaerobaculia bacterium]|nr:hypothetical protein [Thermoanaerobaculia bacterium]
MFDNVAGILHSSQERSHARSLDFLDQDHLVPLALALAIWSIAATAEYGLEGVRVDQHPALDMRIWDGDNQFARMSLFERRRRAFHASAALRQTFTIGICGNDQEVGPGVASSLEIG